MRQGKQAQRPDFGGFKKYNPNQEQAPEDGGSPKGSGQRGGSGKRSSRQTRALKWKPTAKMKNEYEFQPFCRKGGNDPKTLKKKPSRGAVKGVGSESGLDICKKQKPRRESNSTARSHQCEGKMGVGYRQEGRGTSAKKHLKRIGRA